MTMFGVTIPFKYSEDSRHLLDDEVNSVLRRNDERRVFKDFLSSKTLGGNKIFDEVTESVRQKLKNLKSEDIDVPGQALLDFAVSKLKTKFEERHSLYDTLVRKIIENENPEFIHLHRVLDRGEFDGRLPFGYPDASKKANSILIAKIKDTLPDVKGEYLEQKFVSEKIRELARRMFYGINKLGLSGKKLINYLGLLFEIDSIQTAPVEKLDLLGSYISNGFLKDQILEFYFIKCLRFSYPSGSHLKIITHLGAEKIEDRFGGIFLNTDESGMFKSITDFERIFTTRGLRVKSTIFVADNDLLDNFPSGFGDVIPIQDVRAADADTEVYIDNLRSNFANGNVVRLTEQIENLNKKQEYERIRTNVIVSLRKGDGKFVSEKIIEGLVEYRYDRDRAIFDKSSRELARERVYQKMASQIAMQVLCSEGRCLITNSHGNENDLIAGGKMPIIFTDIYREEKVFENV